MSNSSKKSGQPSESKPLDSGAGSQSHDGSGLLRAMSPEELKSLVRADLEAVMERTPEKDRPRVLADLRQKLL